MIHESLRKKTLKGAAWAFLEKIGTQVVHFLVTVVLARLLSPSDYGVIGMLAVFLSVSQLFIDSGFGSALIRTKDRTEADFSTVFWYNFVVSIVCYVLLFFAAPYIASFYNMPILKSILRVLGINLVIQALYTIQVTRLTALVNFGLQAKIAVSSSVVSGVIGISLAFCGFGAWSLVGQTMTATVFSCVVYWLFSGWRPQLLFSRASFHRLFGFGSRIMLASSLHTIYANISPLIIGRKYSADDLGFYTRGDGLASLPGGVFQSTLGRVIFPVLSSIQDDEQRLKAVYNRYLRLVTSLVAPLMLLLAACARPTVILLLGEKWLPCVPYLQLLAIAFVVDPILRVNLNILYVKGRSDVVLKLEIIKKIIAILIVVTSVQFGVMWLCVGRVVYAYIALVLNIYYCGPYLGMGFWRQMYEVAPIYLSALVAAIAAYVAVSRSRWLSCFCNSTSIENIVTLLIACLMSLFLYLTLAWLQKFDFIDELRNIVLRLARRAK